MDDPSSIVLLVLLALLLVSSGFFSGTETALFALNRVQRRRFEEASSIRAQLITRSLRRPRELLSTILFGNTLVNIATSAVATLFFERLLRSHGLMAAIIVDSLLVLFIGEIIPKTIAVNRPERLARMAIMPLHAFARVSRPIVTLFDRAARELLGLLQVPEQPGEALTASELESLFDEARRKAAITAQQGTIARRIIHFSETTAGEIMTPRVDLVCPPLTTPNDRLEEIMIEARHSRIPVYEGGIDHIVGFINTKEFFLNPDREIRELVNPVAIFPEGAKISRVFQHMQKNRINMVVVVNEYGETAGITTMEDIVEEVLGEIYDEYEREEELIRAVDDDTWLITARAAVDDVNEACGLTLPEGESVTLNGYLCDEFGEIPSSGQWTERGGARFTIVDSTRKRILSCRAVRLVPRSEEVEDDA